MCISNGLHDIKSIGSYPEVFFSLRRVRYEFFQMIALVVGVLVMTSILAGATMYLKSIEAIGLRSALTVLSPSNRNLQVAVDRLPLTKR